MEKRIKALYIVTIIGILAFLGMQVYWVIIRYGFSLKEYEHNLIEKIISCIDDYNAIRRSAGISDSTSNKKNNYDTITIPTFSVTQDYGDSVRPTRTSKVYTYMFSAHELLGLKKGTPLSKEQKMQVALLAEKAMVAPTDSSFYDTSGAKDDNEAWMATQDIQTERKQPFTAEGLDSLLNKAGIKATITLSKADSIIWNKEIRYHESWLYPEVRVTVPYLQLGGKTVTVRCAVNPFYVLPEMLTVLVIALLVSVILIVCLILQFSTVLKLSRLDRLRNGFITTMIHELKRPLSTLKMCISGIENEKMMSDPLLKKEFVRETRYALDNLSSYFSKLRDITFNNVEQIPLSIRNVNVSQIFEAVRAGASWAPDKNVEIINAIDPALEIPADGSHLYNILMNLVENAVKYSGKQVTVRASSVNTRDSVNILIEDNGYGISPSDLRHIFNRFYRGKSTSGEMPGMGLGLAYVKLLVNAHYGEIFAESREGEGSCFTIKFPKS